MPTARPPATATTPSAIADAFVRGRVAQWAHWLLLPTFVLFIITGSQAALDHNPHHAAVIESGVEVPGAEAPELQGADLTNGGQDPSAHPHSALPPLSTPLNHNSRDALLRSNLNPIPTTHLFGSIAARAPPGFAPPKSQTFIF